MGLSPARRNLENPTAPRVAHPDQPAVDRPEPASLCAPLCANLQTVTLLIRQAAYPAVGFQQRAERSDDIGLPSVKTDAHHGESGSIRDRTW
jgi:hypothetical protein